MESSIKQEVPPASAAASGPSFDLLDLLAEVASQTLQNDHSLHRNDNLESKKLNVPNGNGRSRRIEGGVKRLVDYDTFDLAQIRKMSQVSLLRLFAEQEADEIRRMFVCRCRLVPDVCAYVSQSFGSETRAKGDMKKHLVAHVSDMWKANQSLASSGFRAESVAARKRRLNSVEDVKQEIYVEKRIPLPTVALPAMSLGLMGFKSEILETMPLTMTMPLPMPSLPTVPLPETTPSSVCVKEERPNVVVEPIMTEIVTAPMPLMPFLVEEADVEEQSPTTVDHDHTYMGRNANASSLKNEVAFEDRGEEDDDDEDEEEEVETNSYDEWIQGSLQPEEEDQQFHAPAVAGDNSRRILFGYVFHELANAGESVPLIGSEVDIVSAAATAANNDSNRVMQSSELPVIHPGHEKVAARRPYPPASLPPTPAGRISENAKPPTEKEDTSSLQPDEIEERRQALEAIKTLQASGSSGDEFWCRVCWPNKKFTAYTTLLSHLRSHAGFRPYECHLCNAFFTRQHSLNYHLLIHTNETRFTCADCGRKFRHPSHFKEHRRRHTGESPYECSDCLIRYKTRNTYKRHLKIYHGKVLTSSGNLLVLPSQEFAEVREAELKKEAGKMERKMSRQRQKKQLKKKDDPPLAAAATAATIQEEEEEEEEQQSEKENLEFLHDSDSLMADNDEVAAISRELENREAVLNGKVMVKSSSAGSYDATTDSEFSSPEPPSTEVAAATADPVTAAVILDNGTSSSCASSSSAASALPNFDASPPVALAPIQSIKKKASSHNSKGQISGQDKSPNLLMKKRRAKSAFNPIQKGHVAQTKRRKKVAAAVAAYPTPLLSVHDNIEVKKQVVLAATAQQQKTLRKGVILAPQTLLNGVIVAAPPPQQQAFLANINGKQVLLIPKKPVDDGAQSKLEQCLRYGSASCNTKEATVVVSSSIAPSTTASFVLAPTGPRINSGIRLAVQQQPLQQQQKVAIVGLNSQMCSADLIKSEAASGILLRAQRVVTAAVVSSQDH